MSEAGTLGLLLSFSDFLQVRASSVYGVFTGSADHRSLRESTSVVAFGFSMGIMSISASGR